MERRNHWESVYTKKRTDEVSWFQTRPEASLALLRTAAPGADMGIIDVGGGDSFLVDVLLDHGYHDITVLDISTAALARAKDRLAARVDDVTWIATDITAFQPARTWDVWHDRAVYHFLTEAEDQRAYRDVLLRALAPGGNVVLATFAPDGPTRCSGLDVVRYSPEDLGRSLGEEFELLWGDEAAHTTPSGATQLFTYTHFRRIAS